MSAFDPHERPVRKTAIRRDAPCQCKRMDSHPMKLENVRHGGRRSN